MRFPNQSENISRYRFSSPTVIARGRTGSYPSSSRQVVIRGIDQVSVRPMPARPSSAVPVDHTLLRMMLSGCNCISPNCVALECPAGCVEGGRFVCWMWSFVCSISRNFTVPRWTDLQSQVYRRIEWGFRSNQPTLTTGAVSVLEPFKKLAKKWHPNSTESMMCLHRIAYPTVFVCRQLIVHVVILYFLF